MYITAGIVALLVAGFVVDRFGLFAERRGWIYWRRRSGSGAGAGVFGEMQTLLSPSYRHVVEEQQRQQTTRHDLAAGAPPLGVDLEQGTAYLDRP